MNRKICVVTGTRAEYGLLRWLMEYIRETPGLELQIIATGMHLSPEFGLTYLEIEKTDSALIAKWRCCSVRIPHREWPSPWGWD